MAPLRFFALPLTGRAARSAGWGEELEVSADKSLPNLPPTPNPSPQGGGGQRRIKSIRSENGAKSSVRPTRLSRSVVARAAVLRRLRPVVHAIVPDDARDPQPVVGEQLTAPLSLRRPMGLEIAPLDEGGLVAEVGEREDLARLREALEALHRDEPVDLVQQRPQLRGDVEVFPAALGFGYDLENHGDHNGILLPPSLHLTQERALFS